MDEKVEDFFKRGHQIEYNDTTIKKQYKDEKTNNSNVDLFKFFAFLSQDSGKSGVYNQTKTVFFIPDVNFASAQIFD